MKEGRNEKERKGKKEKELRRKKEKKLRPKKSGPAQKFFGQQVAELRLSGSKHRH